MARKTLHKAGPTSIIMTDDDVACESPPSPLDENPCATIVILLNYARRTVSVS